MMCCVACIPAVLKSFPTHKKKSTTSFLGSSLVFIEIIAICICHCGLSSSHKNYYFILISTFSFFFLVSLFFCRPDNYLSTRAGGEGKI